MHNINHRHLSALLEVAKCQSFTQAAEQLHVTQSSLTATIKQLESSVGVKLLDRTTRRVQPTATGAAFLPIAQKLVSDFNAALNDLTACAQQQQGSVKIAAAPSILNSLLPAIITAYRQRFPAVGITLREEHASAIESSILANQVDFGIGGNHSNHPELHYLPILQDQYGVISADVPVNTQHLSWQAIKAQPLIMLTRDNGIRTELDNAIRQGELILQLENNLIEASTTATLAVLIQQGLGVSVLPALAASTPAFREMAFTPLIQPTKNRELCLISRRGRALSPTGSELYQRISTYIQSMPLPEYVSRIG